VYFIERPVSATCRGVAPEGAKTEARRSKTEGGRNSEPGPAGDISMARWCSPTPRVGVDREADEAPSRAACEGVAKRETPNPSEIAGL
jgi:hypothetical protein